MSLHHDAGIAKSRFLIRVEPQEDELLSSWLVRTAHTHATSPVTFVNLHFPEFNHAFWTRDVDLSASDDLLNVLSLKSGLSYESLYNLTLRSYEGYLSEHFTVKGSYFIQPLGYYSYYKNGRERHGLNYCPLCLREDQSPYFRKKWRLAFSSACVKHCNFLLDRCPRCESPLKIYRDYFDRNFPYCHKCGADYRRAQPQTIGAGLRGIHAIEQIFEILDSGCFKYGKRYMYSLLFFEILRQVIKIACFWQKDKTFFEKPLWPQEDERVNGHHRNEYTFDYSHRFRYLIFAEAMRLFSHFPQALVDYFKANDLRKTDVVRDLQYLPYEYERIAMKFDCDARPIILEEVIGAIRYLKKRKDHVRKEEVERLMGVSLDLRGNRDDIRRLFRKSGRYQVAA